MAPKKLNVSQDQALRYAWGDQSERAWAIHGRSWKALVKRGLVEIKGNFVTRTAEGQALFEVMGDNPFLIPSRFSRQPHHPSSYRPPGA